MSEPAGSHLTESGLTGIAKLPFGAHLCHFYPDRDTLVAGLVPYIVAGLRNNERCLWITAPPLPATEAAAAVREAMAGGATCIASGQLRILDANHWHTGSADGQVSRWLTEESQALADGFRGLRITGNAGLVDAEGWAPFMDYERRLSGALEGRRIIALCSYHGPQCRATDRIDVVRHHHSTLDLDPHDAHWKVVDVPS